MDLTLSYISICHFYHLKSPLMMLNFVNRLAIVGRMDNAEEGNIGDFLEMIVQWSRGGKNVMKEENCMILSHG